MIQVGAAGKVNTQNTSSSRGSRKTENGGFETEFLSRFREGAAKKAETKDKEVSWNDRKEPELPEEETSQEPSEKELRGQQLNPWMALSGSWMQQMQQIQMADLEGGETLLGLSVEGVLPGQAVPGLAEGDLAALDPMGESLKEMEAQMKQAETAVTEELRGAVEGGEEPLAAPQEEMAKADLSQKEKTGVQNTVDEQAEAGNAEEISALRAEGMAKEDRRSDDGSKEGDLTNGQNPGAEIQGQGLRTQRQISGTQAARASFSETYQGETVRMETSENQLGRDVAHLLSSRMPLKDGVLHLELEPARLGKLTIQVAFESGRTAVTVMSSNAETLEILSKNASQIAQILEDRTGQQTVVYTPQSSETGEQSASEKQGRPDHRQERQQQREDRGESFAQQLRLGLV